MYKKVLFILVPAALLFCLTAAEVFADASAQLEQAQVYESEGNYEQAEQIYLSIVTDYPGTDDGFEAQKRLVLLYISRQGKDAEAQEALDKLVADFAGHPDLPAALFSIAEKYEQLSEYEDAANVYKKITEGYPATDFAFKAQDKLVSAYIRSLKRDADAQQSLDKLTEDFSAHPELPAALYQIARQYEKVRKSAKAEVVYKKIIADYRDSDYAMRSQGKLVCLYNFIGKRVEEQEALKKLVEDFSGHSELPAALFDIAEGYKDERKYEQAFSIYQQIVQKHTDSEYAGKARFSFLKTKAFCCMEVGDDPNAQAAIDGLIAEFYADPNLSGALYEIAGRYADAGRYEKAQGIYQQIIEQYPDSASAYKAQLDIPRLNILLLIDSGDDVNALDAIDDLIADFNDHPDLPEALFIIGEERYYNSAFRHKREGNEDKYKENLEKAIAVWERVIHKLPESTITPRAYYFSARCNESIGEYEMAIQYYGKVLAEWPDCVHAPYAQFLTARCYEQLQRAGRISTADAAALIKYNCEQLLAKYPDSKVARAALGLLEYWNSKNTGLTEERANEN